MIPFTFIVSFMKVPSLSDCWEMIQHVLLWFIICKLLPITLKLFQFSLAHFLKVVKELSEFEATFSFIVVYFLLIFGATKVFLPKNDVAVLKHLPSYIAAGGNPFKDLYILKRLLFIVAVVLAFSIPIFISFVHSQELGTVFN